MSMWMQLASVEHRLGYVNCGGVRTRFLEAGMGNKQALLFLHGSGGYLEAYLSNVRAHAEHFHVLVPDMIGHGYTDKPDHPYEPRHYVEHLRGFCDALGLEQVHLSGESLGGWVAARFATTYPARVGRLVLNTAAGVHYDPAVSDRIYSLSTKAAAEPSRDNIRKRLEWLMLDPRRVTDEMVELRYRIYTQPGYARVMQHIMCLHTEKYRIPNLMSEAEMSAVRAPTLVLWTSHDPGSSVDIGRRLAGWIPGAKFVVMDNCGHWPQFEDADNFNRIQIEFLREGAA